MLFCSKNLINLLYISLSNIFEKHGKTEIGQSFENLHLSSFLYIGVSTANFIGSGTVDYMC